jgi:multidrug efflux pump subunit AcrB
VTFDFTANRLGAGQTAAEYLLVDLDVPSAKVLSRCEAIVRSLPGIEHVLALSENPFDLFGSGPCMVIRLAPAEQTELARDKVIESIRARLADVADATARIRDLAAPGSFPTCRYAIDVALAGPQTGRVRAWAGELGEQLGRNKMLTDVWVNRDAAPRPHPFIQIDREAAAVRGVSPSHIMETLQMCNGALHVSDVNRFGRTWRVEIQIDAGLGGPAKGLRHLNVRNSRGQMIPLSACVSVRETMAPLALHFLDGRPMVEITANAAPGVSVEQVRKLCETMAEQARTDLGLGAAYRVTWLHDTRGTR